jgi:hypothetical protein
MEEKSAEVPLSQLAGLVITACEQQEAVNTERKLTVNPIIAKFASWYEKVRSAMEYREEEVMLRSTIERVLRRRLLLGGNAKTAAEPLVRELIWARYLEDNTVPESAVQNVETIIDLYLQLRFLILKERKLPEGVVNEWIYHLMSSHVEHVLHPNIIKETIANFMFHVLKEHVYLPDESEETRDAQVYIAVRRAFARDDLQFLHFHLFRLYFGEINHENLPRIANDFHAGYQEIMKQLTYFGKERTYSYARKRAAVFFILEDVLSANKGHLQALVTHEDQLKQAIYAACEKRYNSVKSKVRRAIIRSVIFILFTKVIFAFAVEGTYERYFYGEIQWTSLLINTSIPPVLMIIVSFFIRTPGQENTQSIYNYIKQILYNDNPRLGESLRISKSDERARPFLNAIFSILWLSAFIVSYGLIAYVLIQLHFRLINQVIFMFFLTIVSFLSYRLSIIANRYRVGEKQGLITPLVDFFFMPVVRVGRNLTEEIGKFNLLLIVVDFVIETPFKVIFAFFEQWFHFLHSKREELG